MRPQFFLVIVVFLLLSEFGLAHEIRPAYLEIKEEADLSLLITWKQPIMGDFGVSLHPQITEGWMIDSLAEISYTESYLIKRWKIPSNHPSLNEQIIRIDGLETTITDVLIQINLLNDISFTYLIKPVIPHVKLNLSKPQPPPVWLYMQLGVFHIWAGLDHLLFVLGLMFLVKNRTRLFWTITAFTIAHSITLALATLQILKVSSVFTESAIALSIVFLAIEILNHKKGKNGLAFRCPWMIAFLFGLLHGLGFASALSDLGLPFGDIPLALFLFNIGVEIGQIAFVFTMLLVFTIIRKTNFSLPKWVYNFPAYLIGTLAMFWFIERIISIF